MNTYITEWGEEAEPQLEGAVAEVDSTAALLAQLDEAHSLALRRRGAGGAPAAPLWQPAALATLGRMSIAKLDAATAAILASAEERATARNELQLCAQADSLKYGLWVNLARNPRVKGFELAQVGVALELPKQLALAPIAVRVLQFHAEHAAASFGAPSPWQVLGGVALVELLSLPPAPKQVKRWTLHALSGLPGAVSRLAYPLQQGGGESGSSAPAPLRLTLSLPADVLLPPEGELRVGWWDDKAAAWSLAGVSGLTLDTASRELSLLTAHLGALAVLQPTHAQLPYARWVLNPTAKSRSVRAPPAAAARDPSVAGPSARPRARSPRLCRPPPRDLPAARRCSRCRRRATRSPST